MEAAVRYRAYLSGLFEWAVGPPRVNLRVLDFGAGMGTYALGARERGYQVECVELDAGLREHLARLGLPGVPSLDDLDGSGYDLVYSFNVLEHIEDDRGILAKIHQVLPPGGALLLYVPALQVLFSSMDRRVGHLRRYRRGELVAKVAGAGFDVTHCRYVDSLGCLATLAYRVLGDRTGKITPRSVELYDRYLFPPSRALDRAVDRWFGKNLVLLAHRT